MKNWHDQYDKNGKRLSSFKRGYNKKWSKARLQFLANNPYCVHCLKNNKYTPATQVDHIIPHDGDKNLFWDESNWQALCIKCHSRKTAKEVEERKNLFLSYPKFYILWGASGSGKSYYIKKHSGINDIVIDFDELFKALNPNLKLFSRSHTLYSYALNIVDSLIKRTKRRSRVQNVYYLTTAHEFKHIENTLKEFKDSELIILLTDKDTCISNCLLDYRRFGIKVDWNEKIEKWFKEYNKVKDYIESKDFKYKVSHVEGRRSSNTSTSESIELGSNEV